MVVSVPEKTLEHWASIYLTYRYRSKASLWWPASGEDIYVGSLPAVPGKALQLELKTTTLNKKGDVHRVKIDLKQLDHYLALPHWQQPFYVFPMPRWTDTLKDATAAVGIATSEVGFSRVDAISLKPWWFANWMVALPAAQVAKILSTQMAAFKAGGKVDADLVTTTFKAGRPQKPVWSDGLRHLAIPWRTLWKRLEECGAASWPQAVLLRRGSRLASAACVMKTSNPCWPRRAKIRTVRWRSGGALARAPSNRLTTSETILIALPRMASTETTGGSPSA